jgi:DNA-binding PadR family transcriptional regulator
MVDIYDENLQNAQSLKSYADQAMAFFDQLSTMFKKEPTLPNGAESGLTGQITDLAACKNGLNKSVLDSLPPETKETLIKNLERAEKQGLIEINFDKKMINLTEKGEKYIKHPDFQRELQTDLSSLKEMKGKVKTEKIGIELTGTDKDLMFFKNNKTMDLKAINFKNASPELSKKFAENVKKWHTDGKIKLGKDMKIALSEKGKALLKSPEFLKKVGEATPFAKSAA